MSELRDLFESERKRVFEPDVFFTGRVMARLDGIQEPAARDFGIWDAILASTKPVLGVALLLIVCFIALQIFIPTAPQRGIVESFLAPEQTPSESFLYNDTDVPSRQIVLQELIAPEEQ